MAVQLRLDRGVISLCGPREREEPVAIEPRHRRSVCGSAWTSMPPMVGVIHSKTAVNSRGPRFGS